MTGNLGSNWLSVHKSENPLSFHKHEGFIGYAPNPRVDENTDAEGNISLYSHLLLDWGGGGGLQYDYIISVQYAPEILRPPNIEPSKREDLLAEMRFHLFFLSMPG